MEEKKLTDEEIVMASECCERGNAKCSACPRNISDNELSIPDCRDELRKQVLDLIRRLQYGYSSASKASEEWKAKYEAERKENEALKAELKRELAEHEEFTKKAKEEIERLTEENDLQRAQVGLLAGQVEHLKNCGDNFLKDCEKLQKQVDEWERELTQES